MQIVFPWPDKRLSPNARLHRLQVASIKKRARADAFMLSCAADARKLRGAEGVTVSLTFCPPDNRKRDLDNMLSSCKAMLDGLSDAIGVDDSKWSLNLTRGQKCDGGRVIARITAAWIPSDYSDLRNQITGGADE